MVHFVNELWREMEVATAARVVEYGGDRRAAPGALERVVGQKEPSRDLSPAAGVGTIFSGITGDRGTTFPKSQWQKASKNPTLGLRGSAFHRSLHRTITA